MPEPMPETPPPETPPPGGALVPAVMSFPLPADGGPADPPLIFEVKLRECGMCPRRTPWLYYGYCEECFDEGTYDDAVAGWCWAPRGTWIYAQFIYDAVDDHASRPDEIDLAGVAVTVPGYPAAPTRLCLFGWMDPID